MPSQDGPTGNLLLVEGPNDKYVIQRLCEASQGSPNFRIAEKGGVDELLRSIEGHLREPELLALGIVVDANTNPEGRWKGVAGRISRAGIAVPKRTNPEGTIIEGEVRVGVWLMPDNSGPGELEDFIRTMIRPDDPIWPRAERYIEGIPAEDRRFAEGKATGAKVHAWLAAQERPRQMSLAIRAGDLDVSRPSAQAFLEWLTRCFSPAPST